MNEIGSDIQEVQNDRKKLWLRLSIVIGTLLIVIAVILAVLLAQSKHNAQVNTNDQAILESRGSDPEIERIPLTEAKSAFDNQQAVFVDVRSSASFSASHIPGAINIPLAHILDRYQDLDPSHWIILYCT
jgi:hypothetical protein